MAEFLAPIIESEFFFLVVNTIVGIILAIIAIQLIPVVLSIIVDLLILIGVGLAPLLSIVTPLLAVIALVSKNMPYIASVVENLSEFL